MEELKRAIRSIPDFPKEGIVFKDITTLIKDGGLFRKTVDIFAERYRDSGIEVVVSVEARGFIFGAAIAYALGAGVIPVRKPGKLPHDTHEAVYELEYGTDKLEIHRDALPRGSRVLLVDDLLATGGTCAATVELIERLGGEIVGIAFLIELTFLKGREKLKGHDIFSIIEYASEDE
ncbi:MAG: adenine phosphoribosyltransferase [Candidatus Tritonobacter lacicola]|nr:adenine phosphoribosyltransferase [Candidatus Tritonobacter lacicola]